MFKFFNAGGVFLLLCSGPVSATLVSDAESKFSSGVPEGFEGLLEVNSQPINLNYRGKVIHDGFLRKEQGADYFESLSSQQVRLDQRIKCSQNAFIYTLLNCADQEYDIEVTLSEIYKGDEHYISLTPSYTFVKLVNQRFDIKDADSAAGFPSSQREYIADSSVDSVSGALGYHANVSYDEQSEKTRSTVSVNSLVSYQALLFEFSPTFEAQTGSIKTDSLTGSYSEQDSRYTLGFRGRHNARLTSSTVNLAPNKSVIGFWYTQTDDLLRSSEQGTGEPLYTFMPSAGMVEIYRGERLLYVNRHPGGPVEIATSDFPIGSYNVRIVRKPQGTKALEPIVVQLHNSKATNKFSYMLGLSQDEDLGGYISLKESNGEYDVPYLGLAYQSPVIQVIDGSMSWYNVDTVNYVSAGLDIIRLSPFTFNVDTQISELGDWGIGFNGAYRHTLFDHDASLSWSLQTEEKRGLAKDVANISAFYYPQAQFVDSISLNLTGRQYKYENNYTDENTYSEMSVYLKKDLKSLVKLPVDLGLSFSQNSEGDLTTMLTASFSFDSLYDADVTGSYYRNGDNSNAAEVGISKRFEDSAVRQIGGSVGGGEDYINSSVFTDLDFQYSDIHLGLQNTMVSGDGSSSNGYGSMRGGVYFSGDQWALGKSGIQSGIIVDVDGSDDVAAGTGVYASISNADSVELRGGSQVIAVNPYSETDVLLTTIGAVADVYEINSVNYRGNFAYHELQLRETVAIAGMVSTATIQDEYVRVKNHESSLNIALEKGREEKSAFFQLTVSKQHPTLAIYDGEELLCTKNLSEQLDKAKNGFLYVGDISCES
ncbi:TcfC E-set like domain-containing protein [Psychromonas ossibalaenae]|uniref:TcfC E-set like domain-containing protein n=1 Tax=Psychromonas ossibalaenae TaxID=444922 RepID=UPI0003A32E72|nr:TcfC E-set like domain-containing protein [Psychromonas ossibalaenae]